MLRRTLGEHITLSTSLARDVWATRADPGQFQSAIVNMAVNARDAMPQGGKLVVETRNIVLDAEHADFHPSCSRANTCSCRSRTRDGHAARRARPRVRAVFHHQGEGRGTGLGLAMVYGFVKQSGGHVTIYSEVGHGTTINLYFPRVDGVIGTGRRRREES